MKQLDMRLYRELGLAAATRMFRFLDKRFYFTNRLTFDLRVFACEHIGFSRRDDNSQLKRRLNRAIAQLERVGFLEPLPQEARYRKRGRGNWEIVFVRKAASQRRVSSGCASDPLESSLITRGVREPMAARLVREHPASTIHDALGDFDAMRASGKDSALANPPGLLVAWIRERGAGAGADCGQRKPSTSSGNLLEPERFRVRRERESQKETESQAELEKIRGYLTGLSSQERESLEIEAFSHAEPFHTRCYQRTHADGNDGLLREYRDMIVEAHVRRLLSSSAE